MREAVEASLENYSLWGVWPKSPRPILRAWLRRARTDTDRSFASYVESAIGQKLFGGRVPLAELILEVDDLTDAELAQAVEVMLAVEGGCGREGRGLPPFLRLVA